MPMPMPLSTPVPASAHHPPVPPIDPTLLGRIAELLVLSGPGVGPPLVVRLRAGDDGIELAADPVDDVVAELGGTVTPADWHGRGVLVAGRARSLGDEHRGVTQGSVIGRALTSLVVWRDGTVASALSIDGSEPRVQVDRAGSDTAAQCVGRVVDVVRRTLGLPTSAASVGPEQLTVSLWLHRVHVSALAGAALDRATVDALAPPAPATWSAWREQCAVGAWPDLGIAPELAGWMDDGIFAREALGAFPDPLEVVEHLAELLAPEPWNHLIQMLATTSRPAGESTTSPRPTCN